MLEWKFNGRRVASGQLGNELAKAMKSEALAVATEAVRGVRCPVHHQQPANIRVREEAGQLRFQYEACCDVLTEAVEKSFQ